MRKFQHLHAGVERENFKIDCVGPADIMHVERNVRLRNVCIRLTYCRDTSMSVIVGWLVSANCADTLTVLG